MTDAVWKPHVTVAAVVERDGHFLLVEEHTDEGVRINQPAGHLDPGESLLAAVIRETLEETAWHFEPEALVGIYRWQLPGQQRTYLRFAFTGTVRHHDAARALDSGILRTLWLSPAQLRAAAPRHRSPLVQRCVDDWLSGRRFPLDLLRDAP
jgi:8-oxo-dGTP pyrophosphatase MutT (NUDIX family)